MPQNFERELSLEELANLPDEDIDTSQIPELDDDFWSNWSSGRQRQASEAVQPRR